MCAGKKTGLLSDNGCFIGMIFFARFLHAHCSKAATMALVEIVPFFHKGSVCPDGRCVLNGCSIGSFPTGPVCYIKNSNENRFYF